MTHWSEVFAAGSEAPLVLYAKHMYQANMSNWWSGMWGAAVVWDQVAGSQELQSRFRMEVRGRWAHRCPHGIIVGCGCPVCDNAKVFERLAKR